jgi:hypothetical protein
MFDSVIFLREQGDGRDQGFKFIAAINPNSVRLPRVGKIGVTGVEIFH